MISNLHVMQARIWGAILCDGRIHLHTWISFLNKLCIERYIKYVLTALYARALWRKTSLHYNPEAYIYTSIIKPDYANNVGDKYEKNLQVWYSNDWGGYRICEREQIYTKGIIVFCLHLTFKLITYCAIVSELIL